MSVLEYADALKLLKIAINENWQLATNALFLQKSAVLVWCPLTQAGIAAQLAKCTKYCQSLYTFAYTFGRVACARQ